MKAFGYSFVKWPQAEGHEKAVEALMQEIDARSTELKEAADAITASIKVQQDDLTRINALRAKLDAIRS